MLLGIFHTLLSQVCSFSALDQIVMNQHALCIIIKSNSHEV